MKKFLIFIFVFLVMQTTLGMSFAKERLISDGEVLIEHTIIEDSKEELITLLNGKYFRKLIKDGQIISVKELKMMPTGLKFKKECKDPSLGHYLEEKMMDIGIYSNNFPSSVDYSDSVYLPPVGLQSENSCIGWSAGYYLRTYQEAKDLGWKIKEGDRVISRRVFSPSFIYNQINIGRDKGEDEGAYMEDAGDLLKKIGAASWYNFPYIAGDFKSQPDEDAIESAYPHRIRDWRVLYTKDDSKAYILKKTKEYLLTGDLPLAGIRVGFKFNYPYIDEDGLAIITSEKYANYGHAVLIVGYDDNLVTPDGYGAFKIVNSYGKDWGNDGFAYMSYAGFINAVQSAYVFTDLVNENDVVERVELSSQVQEGVNFELTLEGKGNFDFEVRDCENRVVFNRKGIKALPGLNKLRWDGLDTKDDPVQDGNYSFNLLGKSYSFKKTSKIKSFSSFLHMINGKTNFAEVELEVKRSCVLDMYIYSQGKKIPYYKGLYLTPNKQYNLQVNILKLVSELDMEDAGIFIDFR